MSETTLLRKISAKAMGWTERVIVDALGEKKSVMLFSVAGIVRQCRSGETTFGPFLEFRGSFAAQNVGSSTKVVSNRCFVPPPFDAQLEDALAQTNGGEVEFHILVGVIPSDRGQSKYEYIVESIRKIESGSGVLGLLEIGEEKAKKIIDKQKPLVTPDSE